MGFSCGIVGLPNVGKSTLFNSLSNAKAEAANFPFCTIEPNVGIVAVPDARIGALAKVFGSEREVPTSIRFVDIAGLVRGASKGEGLGNQFLSHIREVDAVAHVVRCFEDENVVHVENKVDPVADIGTIQTELCLKDLDTAQKRLDRARKQSKGGDATEKLAVGLCERLVAAPRSGQARAHARGQRRERARHSARHAAAHQQTHVLRRQRRRKFARQARREPALPSAVEVRQRRRRARGADLRAARSANCRARAGRSPGIFGERGPEPSPGLNAVIRTGYELLGLITYLTAGKQESRAWTVLKGSTAPQAAGAIHTDFERGFIKAEVIWWEDLVALGSEAKCREAGKLAIEGRDYVVRDGDVIHFRFNV